MELCIGVQSRMLRVRITDFSGYALDKAKESCNTSGEAVSDHFVDVNKMIRIYSGTER